MTCNESGVAEVLRMMELLKLLGIEDVLTAVELEDLEAWLELDDLLETKVKTMEL